MDTRAPSRPTDDSRVVGDVVVTSRHMLVTQAITAGLVRRSVEAKAAEWATEDWQHDVGREGAVLVIIDELTSRPGLDAVAAVVGDVTGSGSPVLVLTSCPPGPPWGAMFAAGASGVMTSDCSLEELEEAIRRVSLGQPLTEPSFRTALEEHWLEWLAEEERLRARVETLSPRETSVLAMLAQGQRVADIGRRLGVTEGTVRSHVRSLRRKLGVDSQLGAVAIARRVAGRLPERPVPPAPRRPRD